jgi:hypothetical protein
MNKYVPLFACGLLVYCDAGRSDTACPDGTLWEPYSEICAAVRDVRSDFLPLIAKSTAVHSSAPVPGTMTAGTAFVPEQLAALDSGRLHTRMFVYPDGLERDAPLPSWLYTTATSRVDNGLEVLAMYSEDQAAGYLGLFAWTCLPDFPCPDGDVAPGWQWSRPLPELACNVTHAVDQGGHAQKQLYYGNHSDRLDNGSPPLWKSAVYLWNYCDSAWDLAWEHEYRQEKTDCSIPGATCAWWGPSIEIFGDSTYPQIGELGYEDSLLYHDGAWSQLVPPETQFRDPADPSWGSQTPWQLFHLEPNRSYGVGNWFNDNDAPVIEGQVPLATPQGEPLTISTDDLTIDDPDIDPAYHAEFKLTVYGGENYSVAGTEVAPEAGFTGSLQVPVSVNDGAAESTTFELRIGVGDEQDTVPPEITLIGAATVTIQVGNTYTDAGATATDNVDGDISDRIVVDNPVDTSAAGSYTVSYSVEDAAGNRDSATRTVIVQAEQDTVPPEITLIGAATVTVRLGDTYTDAGATATDDVDGDISDRIVVDNPVDTSIAGTYLVSYSVEDAAGNRASATRSVIVQAAADTVPPEITLIGAATVTIQLGAIYTDSGATATDDVDGDITERISVDNPVDTSSAGTYTVSYSVEDLAGNRTSATRTVIVQAAAPPPAAGGGGGAFSLLLLAALTSIACLRNRSAAESVKWWAPGESNPEPAD